MMVEQMSEKMVIPFHDFLPDGFAILNFNL